MNVKFSFQRPAHPGKPGGSQFARIRRALTAAAAAGNLGAAKLLYFQQLSGSIDSAGGEPTTSGG
jgi:hypothetical protein